MTSRLLSRLLCRIGWHAWQLIGWLPIGTQWRCVICDAFRIGN